jgi:hypothetical protein
LVINSNPNGVLAFALNQKSKPALKLGNSELNLILCRFESLNRHQNQMLNRRRIAYCETPIIRGFGLAVYTPATSFVFASVGFRLAKSVQETSRLKNGYMTAKAPARTLRLDKYLA